MGSLPQHHVHHGSVYSVSVIAVIAVYGEDGLIKDVVASTAYLRRRGPYTAMRRDRLLAPTIVVAGLLLTAAAVLYALNTVPFCTPNYTLNGSTIILETAQKQDLQSKLGGMERSVVKQVPTDVEVADLGPTVAYYSAEDHRFWVVQEGTIAGDLYYGPFPGEPRMCTFYPATYEIGRAARVLGN